MIETNRLILRNWCDEDYSAFARLNADPRVMRYFPACLSTTESDALAERLRSLITQQDWGIWAVVLKQSNEFIGFTGLYGPTTDFTIEPSIEVAWRFATQYWGKGYATEAASAVIAFGFEQINLAEIIAFTAVVNQRSQAVMQRLGMQYQYDFAHPDLAVHHPLSQHCLYKIKAA
ncbi:MAG: GNAT family N-acetyltransferase [Thiotrichaceae bacterium]|jgi:RimJ/RimL family protein N-acetyltransferase|uniref:GNAT family N-acetyltransferase n=1 Tax=Candidatus Thiocaldithrix dubininis TaxID=3080823 RepID=A0AA95H133_9GAMM|nr:MAG: GNAT family N-acetyltransferase [Candidatus Thiocaldithrix dubininis]